MAAYFIAREGEYRVAWEETDISVLGGGVAGEEGD